jgi:hypothetical protein
VQRLMHQATLFPMLDLPSKKIPPNSMALVQAAIAQPGVQIPEPPDDSHALDAFNIIPVFYVRDREHTYEMRTVPRKGRP